MGKKIDPKWQKKGQALKFIIRDIKDEDGNRLYKTDMEFADNVLGITNQSHFSNIVRGRANLQEWMIDKILEKFPQYRRAFLEGIDSYPTQNDLNNAILKQAKDESFYMNMSFQCLALLNDYEVDYWLDGDNKIRYANEILDRMKTSAYILKKNGKEIRLSLDDSLNLQNHLIKYFDLLLDDFYK